MQPTLGSLVLCATSEARSYGELPPAAWAEQGRLIAEIERVLGEFVHYQRINYLMLMMVDPHVHFHVIPRYEGTRAHGGVTFPDAGWPAVPALGEARPAPAGLAEELRVRFAAG
jgi:diadenosine tetraphosphate (Ap4A) HIT family hydrolase